MTTGDVIVLAGLAWAFYAYVGFPALLVVVARLKAPSRSAPLPDGTTVPDVTVIIPAYNEERSIGARIENVLASDYPRARLDVIVVSDASTDRTDDIVRVYADAGVRLVVQESRRGKTAGLNRAMRLARGELLVFTDANAIYAPGTIRTLVRYFQRPTVGLVSGFTKYIVRDGGQIADATNAYTRLELAIKRAESTWGCCIGADGAIFAMRRSLYEPLRDDDINDLVLPLKVIGRGYECLLADDAFCSESPGKSLDSEFRRQSRITNRSLRAIWRHLRLLNPFRFPVCSFLLFSHKIARFLVPVALTASLVSPIAFATHPVVLAAAVTGAALAVALIANARLNPAGRVVGRTVTDVGRLGDVFLTVNVAMLNGWARFLVGDAQQTWQHDRTTGQQHAESGALKGGKG